MIRMIGCVLLCLPLPALCARFAVGNDPACTHATLGEALAATASNEGADEIVLAVREIQAAEFTVRDDSLAVIGGFERCDDSAPAPGAATGLIGRDDFDSRILTVINDGAARVVSVRHVRFLRPKGAAGGAIAARTSRPLQLTLENVAVIGHRAEQGAGILIESALEGPVTLTIRESTIGSNQAVAGGGVMCGPGEVYLYEGAEIASNSARYGGGIASSFCQVRLHGDSSTRLAENSASIDGGGIYFAGAGYTETLSVRRASSADSAPRIEGNTAGGYGGAIRAEGTAYVDSSDGVFRFNRAGASGGVVYGDWLEAAFSRQLPGPACAPGECAVIEGNEAGLSPIATGAGGVVASQGGGRVLFDQQLVLRNTARTGSVSWCNCDHVVLGSAVFANHGASEVFRGGYSSAFGFTASTAAGNLDITAVVRGPISRITVDQSILGDAAPFAAEFFGNPFQGSIQCSVVHPVAGTATTERNVIRALDPGLIGPAGGDVRLREDSVSIDRCARVNFNPAYDLDGLERGVAASQGEATYDAGAYEWRPMFRDGFESESTNVPVIPHGSTR